VSLLEEVMRSGTAAATRARGFVLPAAGKTGTSDHDGWFAGFTTKLICVVWVGYDDGGRELKLEGAHSALPIWTEFMKRAHRYREYRGVRPFVSPDGVITAEVDPSTGQLATSGCPHPRSEVFVAGTQPVDLCRLHGGGRGGTYVAGWDTPVVPADEAGRAERRERQSQTIGVPPPPPLDPASQEKPKSEKRGFFGRIRDIFR
jgi:penicillin-binding protein 1B